MFDQVPMEHSPSAQKASKVDRRKDPKTNAHAREMARLAMAEKSNEAMAAAGPIARRMRAEGALLREIAEALNAAGLLTAKGLPYQIHSVLVLLDRLGVDRPRWRRSYVHPVATA